jgi:dienelactone hydrolase
MSAEGTLSRTAVRGLSGPSRRAGGDVLERPPARTADTSRASADPRAIYITDGDEPIFAVHHPASAQPRGVGVIICPPFGWEDMSSYRSRREWAERLAGTGFDVLRIDFPGSGDSGGGPHDAERLRAWTDAVGSAARWLAGAPYVRRIAAIGIGLGGAIAYRAAATGAPIDDLVLWGVSSRGRRHLRELRAFSYLESRSFAEQTSEAAVEDPGDGVLAVAGYAISAETQRELDELDLAELACPPGNGTRVLMLERDGQPADARLTEAIERSGAELTLAAGDGYGAMMMADLPHSRSAETVLEAICSWLAAGGDALGADGELAAGAERPPHASHAEITTADGGRARETAITIPHSRGRLVGILTEPTGPAADLCAVWLNAGPQRRIGPNRMWVEAARRWAELGVPSFRVDLAGIGDADGDSRLLLDNNNYYTGDYLDQVHLVLDELQGRGLPGRFLVGGLCAGAYWALHIADGDTRVSAAAVLNPGYLIYDGGLSNAILQSRSAASRLLDRATWRRVLRGQVDPGAHLRAARIILLARIRAAFGRLTRLPRGGRGAGDELTRVFNRLAERDQRALIVFAGEERLLAELSADGRMDGLRGRPNVRFEHVRYAAEMHTLRPLILQRETHRLLDELLRGELDRAVR